MGAATMPTYTPTERAFLKLLADGRPHTRRELHSLLADDLGALSNIQPHICRLRAKLKARGLTIICELFQRRLCYRQVRLLPRARE